MRPGTSDARTCRSSIAIGSPSARRSRLTATTGSEGETCRMRPRRAPAGISRRSSVRLPGCEAARAHVVAERRDVDALRDLRLGDERAGAAPADEVALAHELVERRAHGQPRDAEVDPELALGGDRLADAERLDQLEDALACLALLRHRAPTSSAHRRPSRAARPSRDRRSGTGAGSTRELERAAHAARPSGRRPGR